MPKPTTILHSWEEFNDSLKAIALIDARVAQEDAKRKLDVIDIEHAFAFKTGKDLEQKRFLEEQIEGFFLLHRKEVEATGRKTKEFAFGKAGMRTGQPTLKLLKNWTWDKVLNAMQSSSLFGTYVKTKFAIDKAAVKTAQRTPEQLATVGQKEEFFYECYPEKAVQA